MKAYDAAYTLMQEIYNNFNRADKLWFLSEDPVLMHNSLGRHLRNHTNLWDYPWKPEYDKAGIDHSPNHPDAISSRVIRDFQSKAKRLESVKRKEQEND